MSLNWLAQATVFSFKVEERQFVKIELRRGGVFGPEPEAWAVVYHGLVLSMQDGGFIYDPMPSSRTDNHLRDTRFSSKEEAYEAFQKFSEEWESYRGGWRRRGLDEATKGRIEKHT